MQAVWSRHRSTIANSQLSPKSHDSFLAGLKLYRARPDKGYSLTDYISMETMARQGLTDALTNDKHFEQEGFRVLLILKGAQGRQSPERIRQKKNDL